MRTRHRLRGMIFFALTRISSASPPTTHARDGEGKIMSPGVLVDSSISRIWKCEDNASRVSWNSFLRCRGINNGIMLAGGGRRLGVGSLQITWGWGWRGTGIDKLLMHMLHNYLKQTIDATLPWLHLLAQLLSIRILRLIILLSSVISDYRQRGNTWTEEYVAQEHGSRNVAIRQTTSQYM